MYYAFKDSNSNIGFIPVGMERRYPNGVPAGAIRITDEQHADFFNKQTQNKQSGFDIIDGVWTYVEPQGQTIEEQQATIQKQLTDAVQTHMDSIAKTKGYDNLLSAVTYAEEPTVSKFQSEGIAFRAWRSAVWSYCYAQLAAALSGERAAPTVDELIAELPALELP